MTKKCSELVFISRIKRDGSGTAPVDIKYKYGTSDLDLELHPLSITEGTFIVFMFNAFVVKLKGEIN